MQECPCRNHNNMIGQNMSHSNSAELSKKNFLEAQFDAEFLIKIKTNFFSSMVDWNNRSIALKN